MNYKDLTYTELKDLKHNLLEQLQSVEAELRNKDVDKRTPRIYFRLWLVTVLRREGCIRRAADLCQEYEAYFNTTKKVNTFSKLLVSSKEIIQPYTKYGQPYYYGLKEWFDGEELKPKYFPKMTYEDDTYQEV